MATEKNTLIGSKVNPPKQATTSQRTHDIVLQEETVNAFMNRFRNKDAADPKNKKNYDLQNAYIANLPLRAFNGSTGIGQDKQGNEKAFRGITAGNITVNMGTYSNAFSDTAALPKRKGAANNSKTPVDVELNELAQTHPDGSEQSVKVIVNLSDMATANAADKNAYYKSAKVDRQANGDRIDYSAQFTSTDKGVGSSSFAAFQQSVGQMALQQYVFTEGKGKGADGKSVLLDTKTVQSAVDNVAKVLSTEYNAFMKKLVAGDKSLGEDLVSGKTGDVIKGSALKTPDSIKFVGDDKKSVYGISVDGTLGAAEYKAIRDIGERFNREFSQKLNNPDKPLFAKGSLENKLANLASITPYAASLKDEKGNDRADAKGLYVMNPAITAKFQPFVSSLVKAHDACTYGKDDPKLITEITNNLKEADDEFDSKPEADKEKAIREERTATPMTQYYDKAMLDNCKTLADVYYPQVDPKDKSAEAAKKLAAERQNNIDSVIKAFNGASEGKSKGGKGLGE